MNPNGENDKQPKRRIARLIGKEKLKRIFDEISVYVFRVVLVFASGFILFAFITALISWPSSLLLSHLTFSWTGALLFGLIMGSTSLAISIIIKWWQRSKQQKISITKVVRVFLYSFILFTLLYRIGWGLSEVTFSWSDVLSTGIIGGILLVLLKICLEFGGEKYGHLIFVTIYVVFISLMSGVYWVLLILPVFFMTERYRQRKQQKIANPDDSLT